MDLSFFQKLEEAKAEALSKLVKKPEELISRKNRWALSSDSYRRWLYLTDCEQGITVEVPVPMLGDGVVSQVTWEEDEVEVAGWNGSFRFNPAEAITQGKPMEEGLGILFREFRIEGSQSVEYQQDNIVIRNHIRQYPRSEELYSDSVIIRLSRVYLLGMYDLSPSFDPDQWYELASVEEDDEDGEILTYRRIVWTSGNRLYLALVKDFHTTWEYIEELAPDLDFIFHMMPWRAGFLSAEEMELFVNTYADSEGEADLPEILSSLEGFIEETINPAEELTKHFYQEQLAFEAQVSAWEIRMQLLRQALQRRIYD